MPEVIQQLMEKIDSRVMRERVLIFLTILAVVFMLWDFLLQGRIDKQRAALDREAQQISNEQKALESRISELTLALANDPAIVRKNEIEKLNQRISEVEARLSGLSQGLIGAAQLPKALEDVLRKTEAVTVLQVRTLPVNELRLTTNTPAQAPASPAAKNTGGTGVFKHGVLIRVSGSYQQLLQLLTDIETLEWRFYWESLDYRVTEYPKATIDIRVFTLSSEEGLLGV